ncbi:Crp/Fnr family transcriptional regulator [Pseudarthrobacter sp. NPDC058196]|uniref:Crp/Fnr family transcriptional regulator n=1 Tax=Pseudarthrobacter sp. NPDC058196 TaxID=3346376 RepID=UPI0036D7B464
MTVMSPSMRGTEKRAPWQAASARTADLEAAWQGSRLSELPDSFRRELLAGASLIRLQRDETVRWDRPSVLVVCSGRVIIYVSSIERMAAMRFLGPGDMTGLAPAFLPQLGPTELPIVIRASTTSSVMCLSRERLSTLAQREGAVAWRIGQWLAEDMVSGHTLLTDGIFFTVRQRLAQALLNLAVQESGRLIVHQTQQHLAEIIGSVRTVVGRELSDFQERGLLVRQGRTLAIIDPDNLRRLC